MEKQKILAIGFYFRQNTGDDAYLYALPSILPDAEITFLSMDDVEKVPEDINIVICGGGDIINDYFMKKAQNLLKDFKGRTYGVSIGIPYQSCSKYFHIFDHIFARSKTDYDIACKEIGSRNVTFCSDITTCIPINWNYIEDPHVVRVGLCLAQPIFFQNTKREALLKSIINSLKNLYDFSIQNKPIEYHIVAFNYSDNREESDTVINKTIFNKLKKLNIPVILHNDLQNPRCIIDFIANSCEMTVCMRYHSVIFSMMSKTRLVALFSSSKIKNVLDDIHYDNKYTYKMDTDKDYKPLKIIEKDFTQCLKTAYQNLDVNENEFILKENGDIVHDIIIDKRKGSELLIRNDLQTFEAVLTNCKKSLIKYLHLEPNIYDEILHRRCKMELSDKSALNISRFICFMISGRTHHPCVWGLAENMIKDDFCLYDAIYFIWQNCKISQEAFEKQENYYPFIENLQRKVLVNLDYIFQNDFSSYHRSGWSYVIGGIMNLDAPQFLKQSDILIDTYVDRSFHWGQDIMLNIGVLPYRKPWYGFIHHTFDETHSDYNCSELFRNPVFLESLKSCRGLLVLTNTLKNNMLNALSNINIQVPVHTLYHPMEFVPNVFTIEKYIENKNKRLVQIGAWLRNPYAIYELPLPNSLKIQKTALRGKEMDQYFAPPDFITILEEVLIKRQWFDHKDDDIVISRQTGRHICRHICRHPNGTCKFCQGFFNMAVQQLNSVEVLEKLNNEDYDKLLSENIVFLNLVDCSAVNTVVECIVRNTVLIINRLPALEEILGENYPGFYSDLSEVTGMCQNIERIKQIYEYLKRLDKTRYKLDVFIDDLQNIICGNDTTPFKLLEPEPEVIKEPEIIVPILHVFNKKLFSSIKRFLPRRYF